jgi:iron complex outermembrane receptor protein
MRSNYDINDDWSIYANASVSRVKSFGRYAPVPSSPWLVGGFGAIVLSPGLPNHPATPPGEGGLNPNWQAYQDSADDILLLTHRFAANGPRDTFTDANVYDVDIGFQGYLFDWEVDFGARRTESQYFEIGRNYIVSALAQPQIDSGAYNIYDPFSVPQETLQSFTATINRDANYLDKSAYFQMSNDLPIDFGAGPIGVAFGGEYRDIEYKATSPARPATRPPVAVPSGRPLPRSWCRCSTTSRSPVRCVTTTTATSAMPSRPRSPYAGSRSRS